MKKDQLRVKDYLDHSLKAIERIQRYVRGLSREAFGVDELVQDAVVRNLEIIGEPAHNIESDYQDFAKSNSTVPWKAMYLMQNRVSHGYFAVDLDTVWITIHRDRPEIKRHIEAFKAV